MADPVGDRLHPGNRVAVAENLAQRNGHGDNAEYRPGGGSPLGNAPQLDAAADFICASVDADLIATVGRSSDRPTTHVLTFNSSALAVMALMSFNSSVHSAPLDLTFTYDESFGLKDSHRRSAQFIEPPYVPVNPYFKGPKRRDTSLPSPKSIRAAKRKAQRKARKVTRDNQ